MASAEISQSWRLPHSARPIKPGEPYVLGFGFTWSARAHYKCLTISACKPACQPSRRRVGLLLALSAPSYWARLFWVKGLIESSRASFLSCDAMLMGIYLFFRNGNSFQCDAGESIRPRDVPGMLARHQGRSQIWGQSCPSFVRISGPRHYCCNFDPCSVLIWRVFMSCFKGRAQAGPAASNSSILASVHAAILIPLQC